MKIWLISLFDPTPDDNAAVGRFVGIAQAAQQRGHHVTHFTSTFRHPKKQHRFQETTIKIINDQYVMEYVYSMGYAKNMMPRRFIAHWDFARKLVNHFQHKPKPDIIFLSMPPLSLGDYVTTWAKKNNVPVVTDIIDPWPDSFIKDIPNALRPVGKFLNIPFTLKLKRLLKNSNAITAISKGYLDWAFTYLHDLAKPHAYFYPSVDFQDIQKQLANAGNNAEKANGQLRIIYAGSLASSYDIPAILKAAEILNKKHPGKTQFVIAGAGPHEADVKNYLNKLPNLEYLGWVGKEELMKQYHLANLGLMQHKNSLTQTVTYKLFSYLSAGLPVLNSLQSEMVDIIEENQVGLNNQEGNYEQLAANIETFLNNPDMLKAYSQSALDLTAKSGDTKVVYDQLVAYLEDVQAGKVY